MRVKEVYEKLGEDYQLAISRLSKEERIEKYFLLFLKDGSFAELEKGFADGDMFAAFRAAHTLKGVCANLCLNTLSSYASILTEDLRNGANITHAKDCFPRFREEYLKVIDAITSSQ